MKVQFSYKYIKRTSFKQVTVRLVLELVRRVLSFHVIEARISPGVLSLSVSTQDEMKWQVLSGRPSVLLILLQLTISSSAWPSFQQQLASDSYHEPPSSNFQNQTADLKSMRQLLSFDNGILAFCTNLLQVALSLTLVIHCWMNLIAKKFLFQLVFCLLGLPPVPQSLDSASEFLRSTFSSGAKFLSTSNISPAAPILKAFYSTHNFFQALSDAK